MLLAFFILLWYTLFVYTEELLKRRITMHTFKGKWITTDEFFALPARNIFHRQLEHIELPCDEHRNRHILFRKRFFVNNSFQKSEIFITADDYYKLYINGKFVAQGPAPSYHFKYNYNCIDITDYLTSGENTIAVHTIYHGLINRVWQSGDFRHGLLLDLEIDGVTAISSDESFKARLHSGYREIGTVGYDTQFLEDYDSRSPEAGFMLPDFDDGEWENAKIRLADDHKLSPQETHMLEFEDISPKEILRRGDTLFIDFGANYVGYLNLTAKGKSGERVIIRCGQELNPDGSVRYAMRCNCTYEESWILNDGESILDWFDYKAFRYAEIILPRDTEITAVSLTARYSPFELRAKLKDEFAGDARAEEIFKLCVHTQKYGVQEVIQDCPDREKGFYLGDGCYTAITNCILTGDDGMLRKLIDDAFLTFSFNDGLVTCMDCSFMQEIAEFPLILVYTVLWHYRISGDLEYLKRNYPFVLRLLENYRESYEKNYILSGLDKWCVVEWPANFRDGYDVDIVEGKVCREAHISINSYYIAAIMTANKIAKIIGEAEYRSEKPLIDAFTRMFYLPEKKLFRDGERSEHISLVGNVFPLAFGLCPCRESENEIFGMIRERKISSLSLFCTFLAMSAMVKYGRYDLLREALLDEGAWLRMLREGATTTYEGWGRDSKWNTSLFHLTFSYAALFLSDTDLDGLFS